VIGRPDPARPLFSGRQVFDVLERGRDSIRLYIDQMDADELLNAKPETLAERLVERHRLDAPALHGDDEVELTYDEAKVNTGGSPLTPSWRQSPGTRYDFHVPFDGDSNAFQVTPSQYFGRMPSGYTADQELILGYLTLPHMGGGATATNAVRAQFDQDLREVKAMLENLQRDFDGYNAGLSRIALERIENRRAKLLGDRNVAESLGVPIRRREGSPPTYVHAGVRRKPPMVASTTSRARFAPEPALDTAEYEHILSVIGDMARVMELSPSAFENIGEEHLRFMFLVPLNGHYESATGETFNFEGKTDVLVRVEGKNIFIAECKFWDGPKAFTETVDQLLGYSSWRDTKTAIVLFNRGRKLTRVLEQIPELLKGHPNFRRSLAYASETGFRCVMHHKDDPDRELTVTVLVFEVPTKGAN
jgi:hypothetical protein